MTTSTPRTSTRSTGQPDVVTSAVAAGGFVAELREHASNLADCRQVRDLPRHLAARVRALLRTARQFEDLHATTEADVELDADLDRDLGARRPVGEGGGPE